MIKELMEYAHERIKNYRDEKNDIFYQCSPKLYGDPTEGTIEIKAPRKYRHKKRLERRLETAVKEFYSKHGFNLKEINGNNETKRLYFEREINSLEKYLILIERQGIFFYIHVREQK